MIGLEKIQFKSGLPVAECHAGQFVDAAKVTSADAPVAPTGVAGAPAAPEAPAAAAPPAETNAPAEATGKI